MQDIYPRKGFGYYLLGTTCLTGQLAVVSYGLLTVLGPVAAAAAFVGGIFLVSKELWKERNSPDEYQPKSIPTPIKEIFDHLTSKAGLPNTEIWVGSRCSAKFDYTTNTPRVILSPEAIASDGPYNIYEVAAIIGHELGHHRHSIHAGRMYDVIQTSIRLSMMGLGIGAVCALIGPAGSATGFVGDCTALIATNLMGRCIYNCFNRLVEKKCDQFNAVLTGDPDAMSSVTKKILNTGRMHNEETWALTRTGDERPLLRAFRLVSQHPSLAARRRSVNQFLTGIDAQVLEQSRRQIAAFVPNPNSQ